MRNEKLSNWGFGGTDRVKQRFGLFLLMVVLAGVGPVTPQHAGAADVYVSPGGNNTSPYENWTQAATTISQAVSYASDDDTIWVTNTTYTLAAQIDIGKKITVISTNGSGDGQRAVVNGNAAFRGFYIHNAGAVVAGFVITNCYSAANGGGVYIDTGTLRDCLVTSSKTGNDGNGGGVYANNGILERCDIVNNETGPWITGGGHGGGAYITGPSARADGCLFFTNRVSTWGGGCYVAGGAIVMNSTSSWNRGLQHYSEGGGIQLDSGTVSNVLVCNNTVTIRSFTDRGGGGVRISSASALLTHSRIIANQGVPLNGDGSYPLGGGVYMTAAGTVAHCTIISNTITRWGPNMNGYGAGVCMLAGGVVRDCDIGYNKAYYSHSGGGVLVNGGQLLRCNVFKNEMDYGGGGGVFIDGGGVMTECNVWSNTLNGTFNNWVGYVGGGGVCVGNGTVSNSTIWGNWSYRGGGVEMANASAVLRNCLVMGNNAEWGVASYYGGGVRLDNGRVENCTVVRNTCGTGAGAGGGICRVAVGTATVTNSIFYHNSADDILNADTAGFGYSCASNGVTAGNNGNMTSEPKFVSAGSGSGQTAVLGDYRLQPSSPCVDKGAYLSWMNGATDRAGKKRIFRGVVDMGAFEDDTPRGTVICIR